MSEEWSAPAWAVLAVLGTVAALLLLLLAALGLHGLAPQPTKGQIFPRLLLRLSSLLYLTTKMQP